MIVRVRPNKAGTFERFYGSDYINEHYPAIHTTGIEVRIDKGKYYIGDITINCPESRALCFTQTEFDDFLDLQLPGGWSSELYPSYYVE